MATQTTIGRSTLRLVTGDIAEQDTDAVVTAVYSREDDRAYPLFVAALEEILSEGRPSA